MSSACTLHGIHANLSKARRWTQGMASHLLTATSPSLQQFF